MLQAASAVLLPAVGASAVAAEPAGVRQRLSDGWEFHQGGLGGIWEVWRGDAATSNVLWTKVELPHCFTALDAVDPDREYYEGPTWYRKSLTLANPYPGGRVLLHFEGAGQRCEVWAGLERAGCHTGGYDEFTVDVTEAAARQPGRLDVAVMVDNSRNLESIPSDLSDFVRHGGLYRHVNLLYVPAVSLERVIVHSQMSGDKATVGLEARLRNPRPNHDPLTLHIRLFDPEGKVVAESDDRTPAWTAERLVGRFELLSPLRWSPDSPHLYRAEVSLNGQTVSERFGLRSFEFPAHGVFSLNGKRTFLRGTHRHEDHAGLGPAMPDALVRKELELAKAMGVNFIRLGHYQQSRMVLELCDELGLLVWEEIPWCRGGVGGAAYREQARRMLTNMIDQHRNHPSVVFWGLGNENDWPGDFPQFDQTGVRDLLSELNRIAHEADPTRLTALRRCPFAADIPDVYSPSIWAGWYSGRYTEYKDASLKEIKKVRRMLHTEWGGDSLAGRHSEAPDRVIAQISTGQGVEEKERAYLLTGGQQRASKDGDWSESYICNLFDWHLKEQESLPALAGSAMWVLKDFATPLRPENPVPRVNLKGVLERDLTPKEGYYVFQSYWAVQPMVHLYGHSWPVRWGEPGEQKLVKVYSNCAEAELYLNGRSCGVKHRDSQDFPAAGLRWLVQFEAGVNRLRVLARQGQSVVEDSIEQFYETAKWGPPARFELREIGRGGGVVSIQAQLYDEAGVACLDARNEIRFAAAGDGVLVENLGTAAGSRVVQLANGRALARVRLARGSAAVSVSSRGLPTAIRLVRA